MSVVAGWQFVVLFPPSDGGGPLISNLSTFVLITSLPCLPRPREHYQVTVRKPLVSSWKIQRLPPQSSPVRDKYGAPSPQSTISMWRLPWQCDWRGQDVRKGGGWWWWDLARAPGSFSIVHETWYGYRFQINFLIGKFVMWLIKLKIVNLSPSNLGTLTLFSN